MTAFGRRRFLAGVGGLAVAAAACSDGGNGDGEAGPGTDLDTAARAARLEKLTTDTYTQFGVMITEGRLGAAVPPAVSTLMSTAVRHHLEHFDSWNRLLAAAGRAAVTTPDDRLRPLVDTAMRGVTDIPAAAALALRLEDYASRTYLTAVPILRRPEAVTLAARIVVVDQQHQAVLRYILGFDPVGSGTAREPTDFAPDTPNW